MSPWVWVLAGFAALVLLYAAGLGIRILLYRFVDRRIASYQDDLVAKHCEEFRTYTVRCGAGGTTITITSRQWLNRKLGRTRSSTSILQGLRLISPRLTHWSKSGNVKVDAILNSKLSLAKDRGVRVNVKAIVPPGLSISEIDCALSWGTCWTTP